MTSAPWISHKMHRKSRASLTGRALRADTVCFGFLTARYISHYRPGCPSQLILTDWPLLKPTARSTEIEQFFFGEIDSNGKAAVEYFDTTGHSKTS
jgi:hypothetical protein